MRHVVKVLLLMFVVALLAQPALAGAEDKRFALRFGLVLFEPTSSTNIEGTDVEFQTAFGPEVDFEWYILKRLGLEVSFASAVDGDIETNDQTDTTRLTGITATPITVGVNAHIIRNSAVDFYIGLVGGTIRYGSYDISGGDGDFEATSDKIDSSSTFGAQAAADINVGESWAVNIGLKYLDADATLEGVVDDSGRQVTIDVNPLIFRVMGVFRF
jgi:outer membrane protein W